MPIDIVLRGAHAPGNRWRNVVTGECRLTRPQPGELDWVENASTALCPD